MFESNFSIKEKNKGEQQECARSFESVVRLRVVNAVRVFLDVPGIFSIDLRLLSENSVCAATHSFMVMHRGVRPPPAPSVLSACARNRPFRQHHHPYASPNIVEPARAHAASVSGSPPPFAIAAAHWMGWNRKLPLRFSLSLQ